MRKAELDIVRVLALLLVILQHSCSMLGVSSPVYGCLWMGVPLFVMLSGALQLKPSSKQGTALKFYARRYGRILPPFLIWAAVVFVISSIMHKYDAVRSAGDAVRSFVPYLVTNRINEAYWYVFLIAALYLITPPLKAILGSRHGRCILVCCILVWMTATVLRDIFPSWPAFRSVPLTGRFAGYYLGYFLCGHYVLNVARRKPGTVCAAVVFALALATDIALKGSGITSLSLQAIQTISLFAALTSLKVSDGSSLLTDMSRYSYTAYLTHFLIIGLLYAVLPAVFPQRWFTPLYTATAVLGAEYLMCRALDGIRWVPGWLTGIVRK